MNGAGCIFVHACMQSHVAIHSVVYMNMMYLVLHTSTNMMHHDEVSTKQVYCTYIVCVYDTTRTMMAIQRLYSASAVEDIWTRIYGRPFTSPVRPPQSDDW